MRERRRLTTVARAAAAALVCTAMLVPATAVAAWKQVVGGASPINVDATRRAEDVSLAVVGGVPYVAWTEDVPLTLVSQVRVARLSAAGTAWEKVGGASPLNKDPGRSALDPSIADVGGVPWVAWREHDGLNYEVRVARLNAAGTGWQEVVGGASPINVDPTRDGFEPSLASIGGTPNVAFVEAGASAKQLRVVRLNSAGTAWDDVGGILNVDPARDADAPSLADVGGVAHVAWIEDDLTNFEVRAARLTGGGWVQVEGGASPINAHPDQTAGSPRLAVVAGVPHIGWVESDGTRGQVRVARLNAAGNDWAQIVAGASPVNHDPGQGATRMALADVGGTPYVAWIEADGVNQEVRVARLEAAGPTWAEVVGVDSPINAVATADAWSLGVASPGGVPWVAWTESAADGSRQARVSRLEPEFGGVGAVPTANGVIGATLFGSLKTYGLPFQVGFTVAGPGGGDTGLAPASGDLALLQRDVGGLTPSIGYTFRPFATAGVAQPRVLGPEGSFTALAATVATPPSPTTDPLVAAFVDRLLRARSGTRIRVRYVATRAAGATLELRRGSRLARRFRANARAGLNAFTILAPTAGTYRLVLIVAAPGAKVARATARFVVRRR
jgi:hypothetical protein